MGGADDVRGEGPRWGQSGELEDWCTAERQAPTGAAAEDPYQGRAVVHAHVPGRGWDGGVGRKRCRLRG